MKEESLLLLSDLQKLINQVVLIDYTIIILEGEITNVLGIGYEVTFFNVVDGRVFIDARDIYDYLV